MPVMGLGVRIPPLRQKENKLLLGSNEKRFPFNMVDVAQSGRAKDSKKHFQLNV